MSLVYTMHIQKPANVWNQHPFHLGTIEHVAEQFVMEKLKADPEIVSIRIKINDRAYRDYDHKDLKV